MKIQKLLYLLIILTVQSLHSSDNTKIHNEFLEVTISKIGGELQSIRKTTTKKEYLWHGDSAFWAGRAPIMFPVNVRHKEEKFEHQGKIYDLPLLGIVHSRELEVVAQTQDAISLQLESDCGTLESFPFQFRFSVTYHLSGNKLTQTHRIENIGDNTFYYATGGHPGFVLPKERTAFELTFSKTLNGTIPIITEGLIQKKAISFFNNDDTLCLADSRFPSHGILLTKTASRQIGIAERGKKPFITVDLGDFPNVNIWSPPGKPFVCIEPQVSHHDFQDSPMSLKDKTHLISIENGEIHFYRFSIVVNE